MALHIFFIICELWITETFSFSLLSANCQYFLREIIKCFLSAFKVSDLEFPLLVKVRESSLFCYLTHIWEEEKLIDAFFRSEYNRLSQNLNPRSPSPHFKPRALTPLTLYIKLNPFPCGLFLFDSMTLFRITSLSVINIYKINMLLIFVNVSIYQGMLNNSWTVQEPINNRISVQISSCGRSRRHFSNSSYILDNIILWSNLRNMDVTAVNLIGRKFLKVSK